MDDRGDEVRFQAAEIIFLFSITFRSALGFTLPPILGVPRPVSQGKKLPKYASVHSLASIVEVKNDGAINPSLHMST
jgi:hypothetical protein